MSDIDFAEFVTDLDHGRINQQLGEQLMRVVDAVQETGKQGSLTVKFSVTKEGAMATVVASSSVKTPQHPMHGTLFYFDQRKGLSREDPRQLQLKGVTPPKVVDLPADGKTKSAGGREEG